MEITVNVTVSDFVYEFYAKAASDLGDRTVEEIMSEALFMYAGLIAQDMLTRE